MTKLERSQETKILMDIGFCGNYLRSHIGGKSGKGHILSYLDRMGGSVPQRDLQDEFKLKPASLSELLMKLEGEGLVTRQRDENDSRKLNVTLTEVGYDNAHTHEALKAEFERTAFACYTPEEQERLFDLLERLRHYWETMND